MLTSHTIEVYQDPAWKDFLKKINPWERKETKKYYEDEKNNLTESTFLRAFRFSITTCDKIGF
jgi:hypothetical protein